MYRHLLIWAACLLGYIQAGAQDTAHVHCGNTMAYIASLGIDTTTGGSSALVFPVSYPSDAVDTCGVFTLHYDDVAFNTTTGFDDAGVGSARRQTVCEVLTYIQSVFDFSSVPSGGIRVHIDSSYTGSYPKPASFGNALAVGGAYYIKPPGIAYGVNGFVHEYVMKGSDPRPGEYHADMRFNFDKVIYGPRYDLGTSMGEFVVDYNYGTDTPDNCQFNFYSTVLHICSHFLGWFVFKSGAMPHTGYSFVDSMYSSIDTSIAHGPDPAFYTSAFSPMTKLWPGGIPSTTAVRFWINSKAAPNNYPISPPYWDHLTGFYSSSRISPGDYQHFVMEYDAFAGDMRNEYCKGELETFTDVLHYNYKSSYASTHASTISNHIPYTSHMYSHYYSKHYGYSWYYADTIAADYTITNNIGTTLVYNLAADTSLHDQDGDTISIMPGSLVNFRGCGESGNNHRQLTLSNGNKVITFTPRPNFYGRVQFGYNLFDGKEKGAFRIITIDVLKGSNVSVPPDGNFVLNGDFEEGSEVKLVDTAEYVNNTAGFLNEFPWMSRLMDGKHFADAHPFSDPQVIRGSSADCSSAARVSHGFGKLLSSFPFPSTVYGPGPDTVIHPAPVGDIGNRYGKILYPELFNLADTLKKCHHYVLEFDIFDKFIRSTGARPIFDSLKVGFTRSNYINSPYDTYLPISFTIPFNPYRPTSSWDWKHASIPFNFCSDTPTHVLYLFFNGVDAFNYNFLIDNVSLKESEMTVALSDTLIRPCIHRLRAKVNSVNACGSGMLYSWQKLGGPSLGTYLDPILDVSPMVTTSYVVTAYDGCLSATDTITVSASSCPCSIASLFGDTVGFHTLTGTVTSVPGSGYYYVPADVTMTGTLTYSNSKFLVLPGVSITLSDTTLLTLDSCHVFTCPDTNKLWKGFVLASGTTRSGRINLINNTMIEDAEIAIKAINPKGSASDVQIISTNEAVFNRNIIGIYIENYNYAGVGTYPFRFLNTVFTARSFTKVSYSGYPNLWPAQNALKAKAANDPHPPFVVDLNYTKALCKNGTFAEAGIKLSNVGYTSVSGSSVSYDELVIGSRTNDSSEFNLFDNMGNGVYALNANISLYNNTFIRIGRLMTPPTSTPVFGAYDGSGIYAASTITGAKNRLQVTKEFGLNSPPNNRFYDCYKGVTANLYYEVRGELAFMTTSHTWGAVTPGGITSSNDGYGYYVRSVNSRKIFLANNTISNIHNAIWVNTNNKTGLTPKPSCTIFDNRISGRNPLLGNSYTTGQYVYQGIKLQSVLSTADDSIRIKKNRLDTVYNGIEVSNVINRSNLTDSNSVWMIKALDGKMQCGITYLNTTGGQVLANTVKSITANLNNDTIVRAYRFANNSTLSVRLNISYGTGRGFDFMGNQTGTVWNCNNMEKHRYGYAVNGFIGAQGSYTFGLYSVSGNQWLGSTWSPTTGPFQTFTINFSDPKLSKLYVYGGGTAQPTINSSLPFGTIYTYSTSNGIIVCPGGAYNPCGSGIGVAKLKFMGTPALAIVADTLYYDINQNINRWMSQYSLWRTVNIDTAFNDSSSEAINFMAACDSTRFKWLTDIENALTDEDDAAAYSLMSAAVNGGNADTIGNGIVITDLTDADYIVQHYLDFYSIYRDFLRGNEVDSSALANLANLCPLTDGNVVYQARSLYSLLYNYNEPYDDEAICGIESGGGEERKLPSDINVRQRYDLYPNPNSGSFYVAQQIVDKQPVDIRVYNLQGKCIFKDRFVFNASVVNLQLKALPAGVYLLQIMDSKGKLFNNKFTVGQ